MNTYVARQAIYNKAKHVFGYELLFRDGEDNCFPDICPDEATSKILAGSHLSVGVEKIANNKIAFINFHTDTLINRFPLTLDPDNVVIEIVETVEVSSDLVKACKHMKKQGYRIALDDFDFKAHWAPLLPLIDYIKVEVAMVEAATPEQLAMLKRSQNQGITLIVERVETHEEFDRCVAAGFDFFQGYFLSKPQMVSHKDIEVSLDTVAELITISTSKEFDTARVQTIFENDVGLTFKLMRFVNNPLMNKRNSIDSVGHAIHFLGETALKKLIALLVLAKMRGNKPEELVLSCLVRARFCRLLAIKIGLEENPPNSFIVGLFSHVDALLDQPMSEVMKNLPFNKPIKDTLCRLDTNSEISEILNLCCALDQADWRMIDNESKTLEISTDELFCIHYEALAWAQDMHNSF